MDPLDDLRAKIDRYGWAVRNVSDSDPAKCLSYTVGLTAHQHPEIVMTGLPPDVGTVFLNIVGEIVVREGGRFTAGEATTELAEGPAMPVLEVADKSDLTAVDAIYGDVPALQIVWTDSGGRVPWEPGYANPPGTQRLLPLRREVQERLRRKDSPAQIAGRLKIDFPEDPEMRVSPETIYKSLFLQARGTLNSELSKHLRTGRSVRKPRGIHGDRGGRIKDMVMISERPAEVEDHSRQV